MIDGSLVSSFINFWDSELDLLTNVCPRTFPKGQSLEIINSSFFSRNLENLTSESDCENVTTYFYRNLASVRYKNIALKEDLSNHSLAIDTKMDLERFSQFVNAENESWIHYDFREILKRYPSILED